MPSRLPQLLTASSASPSAAMKSALQTCANGLVAVWGVKDQDLSWFANDPDGQISSLVFLDRGWLLTTSSAGAARLWNLNNNRNAPTEILPGTAPVPTAAAAGFQRLLAIGFLDGSVLVGDWDGSSFRDRFRFSTDAAGIRKLAFSSNGDRLSIARDDGTARVAPIEQAALHKRALEILKDT